MDPTAFYPLLGDPLGALLFSLVLSDYLSSHPSPDGLLYQLWYLDDGALIGSRSALATFLDSLQHQGPGFGLCPNTSFSEFPSSIQQVTPVAQFFWGPLFGALLVFSLPL